MSNVQLAILQSEWITLQTQFDSYEKYSLSIKLFSVLVCCMLVFVLDAELWSSLVIAILWLQDGIWKTFQSRIGLRLEVVEQAIHDNSTSTRGNTSHTSHTSQLGMQFNLAWRDARPSAIGLVGEYIKQSFKPTIAYPHVILIAFVIVHLYVS